MSASEKWPGFVLTKEGEEFVQTNANYLTYDLCYNPLRYESWLKLAKILDEVQQFSVCLMYLYQILAILRGWSDLVQIANTDVLMSDHVKLYFNLLEAF